MSVLLSNFEEGQIWVTTKRDRYRIVDIDTENPIAWYPILVENCNTKILYAASATGDIYNNFQPVGDRLVMQVQSGEKVIAEEDNTRYNETQKRMEEDRKKHNDKVKRSYRLFRRKSDPDRRK